MKERNFGTRSGFNVTPASIGGMRFPRDVDESIEMIRHAIDSGMRYIDTCRCYGESEWILGKALKEGYREKVILSTKWSPWISKIHSTDSTAADCERRRIEESMKRLDVDYLDFYQIWNVNSRDVYDQATAKGGMLDGILKAKDDGLVGHIGFTTHDSVDNLKVYLEEADWCEVLLVTYNLMNQTYAPVLEAAHEKGIGTVVMNPVGGGAFAEESPTLKQLVEELGLKSGPELAIRYVLSNPNIDTLLCGMSRREDVDATIAAVNEGTLNQEQVQRVNVFFEEMAPENTGFCTGCKYCMPCPAGVNIPRIMNLVHRARFWGFTNDAKQGYKWIPDAQKPIVCTACGQCVSKCTQKLDILEHLAYAKKHLT